MRIWISFTVALLACSVAKGQTGLWFVHTVTVNESPVTPVAKWFRINEDGTVLGGNGGIINIRGTWEFDPETSQVLFTDDFGVPDENGPFTASYSENEMSLSRVEEGHDVVVLMEKVSTVPKGPWDICVGNWIPDSTALGTRLFMRWDRRYILSTENGGVLSGTWHIDAHSPELKLLGDDGSIREWEIDFPSDSTMRWTSAFGEVESFVRRN